MDFSKLPKLSETRQEPAAEPAPAPPRVHAYDQGAPRELSMGAEIWISILIGIVFIYFGARPLEYVFHRAQFEQNWSFTDTATGNAIPYPQTIFFLPDIGILALGVVLILDGVQMALSRSVKLAAAALFLTATATLLNIAAFIVSFANGSGFQLLTFLAVVLGGYTAIYQLNAIRRLRYFQRIGATINSAST